VLRKSKETYRMQEGGARLVKSDMLVRRSELEEEKRGRGESFLLISTSPLGQCFQRR